MRITIAASLLIFFGILAYKLNFNLDKIPEFITILIALGLILSLAQDLKEIFSSKG